MCNENSIKSTDNEAAEGHPPAASAFEIINQDNPMSKMWPFVGGVFVGAAGVVAAALVVGNLSSGSSKDEKNGQEEPLALPAEKEG